MAVCLSRQPDTWAMEITGKDLCAGTWREIETSLTAFVYAGELFDWNKKNSLIVFILAASTSILPSARMFLRIISPSNSVLLLL